MQVALGPLNARWRDQLRAEIEVAIGIHTGMAQVGNVGSRRKFKYERARPHREPRQPRSGGEQALADVAPHHQSHARGARQRAS